MVLYRPQTYYDETIYKTPTQLARVYKFPKFWFIKDAKATPEQLQLKYQIYRFNCRTCMRQIQYQAPAMIQDMMYNKLWLFKNKKLCSDECRNPLRWYSITSTLTASEKRTLITNTTCQYCFCRPTNSLIPKDIFEPMSLTNYFECCKTCANIRLQTGVSHEEALQYGHEWQPYMLDQYLSEPLEYLMPVKKRGKKP